MGLLSRFDSDHLSIGGINELDPGRSDLGKAIAVLDPLGLPLQGFLSGNIGIGGTPTQKGVDNPLAVSGITDVAHDKGAEIAAIIAAGSYLGGAAGGGSSGAAGGAESGGGAVGFDPGGELYGIGGSGAEGAGGGGEELMLLAQGEGGTTTDVTPGLYGYEDTASPGSSSPSSSAPSASNEELDAAIRGGQGNSGTNGGTKTATGDSSWMNAAKRYGIPLSLMGISTALSSKKSEIPNQQQYQEMSAEAQALAKQLIEQYRSGTLSPAMQAQVDQATQNAKNQVNNYYASIGQAGSTSHQQALSKVDTDALAMKANMLSTSLQQGLQAIGVALGPLNTMANYKMQQDKRLQDAYANFARSAGQVFAYNSAVDERNEKKAA